uniref:Solute carrier family 66 member 1 n=1 Tax=Salarias fasciatus TaxID=181472 RepID=A0A672H2M6_SALFA
MATARFPGKSVDSAASNWTPPVVGRPLCVNGTAWILNLLEECVDNNWEYCSVVIGLISMFCFLLSTLPQVYEAYRNGKVEEAMSLGFLLFLFGGDVTSFAGCYLTSQLPIQVVTVVFYIFTDLILISQFLYYKIKNSSNRTGPARRFSPSRKLHLFQFQRQSTEGTSYLLFALAMMGNGTYGLSVIVVLPALRGSKHSFIIKHLAWLIGSMGVLVLDFLEGKGDNELISSLVN